MAGNKVWNLMYVVGNPAMFSRVTACADNPMSRATALASAETVANNGGGWRVWVERERDGQRIFESEAEKKHMAAARVGPDDAPELTDDFFQRAIESPGER